VDLEEKDIHAQPNVATSASKLSSTDDLAFLALPTVCGGYHGNTLIDAVVADANEISKGVDEHIKCIETSLECFSPLNYKKPNNPEQAFTRPNLASIIEAIKKRIVADGFEVRSGVDALNFFSFFLAKEDSQAGVHDRVQGRCRICNVRIGGEGRLRRTLGGILAGSESGV